MSVEQNVPADPEACEAGACGYVAVSATKRRRYLWVAWWTHPPRRHPFQVPDAFEGGARSEREAFAMAEARARGTLQRLDGMWARAWLRVQKGLPAWVDKAQGRSSATGRLVSTTPTVSPWAVLGIVPGATEAEIKSAFRRAAMEAHPDRGGDVQRFLLVKWAADEALSRRGRR